MRQFVEPTARNLLRRPLALGVPLPGLLAVSSAVLTIFVLGAGTGTTSALSLSVGVLGYSLLRIAQRFAKTGWSEAFLYSLERRIGSRVHDGLLRWSDAQLTVSNPDTLTHLDLLAVKERLEERLVSLKPGDRATFVLQKSPDGAKLRELEVSGTFDLRRASSLGARVKGELGIAGSAYSLHQLPVLTDPLWLFGALRRLTGPYTCVVGVRGVAHPEIKARVERARRSNSASDAPISDIDAEVTFEEASAILEGLSRGEETLLELSLTVIASPSTELDERYFCQEKNFDLALFSALGVRPRFFRSHIVRLATAQDLIPNLGDACEDGRALLETSRGGPLYFSPQDPRLESLHWVVAGASGSGKSFFTGVLLSRLLRSGRPMSVLFIDRNRSFKRFVASVGAPYLEPQSLLALERQTHGLREHWERPGSITGIELSELGADEEREATVALLGRIEAFLRYRESTHAFYVVLDECWNLMREHPVGVQRAFRECRKLNGAVVALTQSLDDFAPGSSGQSIFQNAPIRILLRQGEDVSRYQGILGLNQVEATRVARLKQVKGEFAECLIKTPYESKLGRLYPTPEEHDLFRTDNLREERVREVLIQRGLA